MATTTATTASCDDDHALLPTTSDGVWRRASPNLPSFTQRRTQENDVPSDEEEADEEALVVAATIARIKQPANRLIRSSCIDPKRDPSMIAPRRAPVDELHRPNEHGGYDSAQSISRMDFEPILVFSSSFGDMSSEPSTEGAYQCTSFAGRAPLFFSDNFFAKSKTNDSGTKNTSQLSNEEEALDTAAAVARIKHSAIHLIRSSSTDPRKRNPSIMAPWSATVDDFQRPKEHRRYDSARSPSKSLIDLKGTYLDWPSFGDKSTETSIGFEAIDDTPDKVRSQGEAYTSSVESGWFPDDIVAISKVEDSGTGPTLFGYYPSSKRVTSDQYRSSSLTSTCGTTQTTIMPSEEGEQRACFTYVSSFPTGWRRCVVVAVIIGLVFLAVPLITLAATGHLRDSEAKSAPTGSPTSNPSTGSDLAEDIFRHRVPHTVGGG